VVKEEVVVLVTLVRRHRHAVGIAVRRAVDDEVHGALEASYEYGRSNGVLGFRNPRRYL
jgi:hypothetical protein